MVGDGAIEVIENFEKIGKSISEQNDAIGQIRQGLSQISAVVQTNAATAEENSATSEEMSAQASMLRQEVGKFRLKGEIHTYSDKRTLSDIRMIGTSDLGLGKY